MWYLRLVQRTCTVSFVDSEGTRHSVEVQAETLYEAVCLGIRSIAEWLDAGLKQVEVANALGRPQSYVSNYENGERKLDLIELRELCHALGVNLAHIVTRWERERA